MGKDIEKALRDCLYPRIGKPNLARVPVDPKTAKEHIEDARDFVLKIEEVLAE